MNKEAFEKLSYRQKHRIMRKMIPKPENCPFCLKNKRLCMTNKNHLYKFNINHWEWKCYSCHMQYDFKNLLNIKRGHHLSEKHKENISKGLKGHSTSLKSRQMASERWKEKNPSWEPKRRKEISEFMKKEKLKHTFTKEYLEREYLKNRKSMRQIGRENKCSHSIISKWIKLYNIPIQIKLNGSDK